MLFVLVLVSLVFGFERWEAAVARLYMYPMSAASAALLNLSGVTTKLDAASIDNGFCLLVMENAVFRVIHECTGIFTLLILLSAVVAYPARPAHKVCGIALAAGSFFAYGSLRLLVLGIAAHFSPGVVALAVSLLLIAGDDVGEAYTVSLTGPVNRLLGSEGLPVSVSQRGDVLLLRAAGPAGAVYPLRLEGGDVLVASVIGVLALFLATPRCPLQRRLLGVLVAVALLWAMHAFTLYVVVYAAIGSMLAKLPPDMSADVLSGAWSSFSVGRGRLSGHLAGAWVTLVGPGLVLLVWVHTVPRLLEQDSPAPTADS